MTILSSHSLVMEVAPSPMRPAHPLPLPLLLIIHPRLHRRPISLVWLPHLYDHSTTIPPLHSVRRTHMETAARGNRRSSRSMRRRSRQGSRARGLVHRAPDDRGPRVTGRFLREVHPDAYTADGGDEEEDADNPDPPRHVSTRTLDVFEPGAAERKIGINKTFREVKDDDLPPLIILGNHAKPPPKIIALLTPAR